MVQYWNICIGRKSIVNSNTVMIKNPRIVFSHIGPHLPHSLSQLTRTKQLILLINCLTWYQFNVDYTIDIKENYKYCSQFQLILFNFLSISVHWKSLCFWMVMENLHLIICDDLPQKVRFQCKLFHKISENVFLCIFLLLNEVL